MAQAPRTRRRAPSLTGPLIPAFDSLDKAELDRWLAELDADLAKFSAREPVTWVLATAFNDLLVAVKRRCVNDPIAAAIAVIAAGSIPAAATARALIGQLRAALVDGG